ncbi:hypothetical protein Anas_03760 [Armadillidium nasatum]|uniref:Uncharacterized protein n=1 Tax=Armadillidium nasatum TaxID=96803 RepID=A0A5N5THK5_9CRUS|nr:hypothetical protein Anas_03760 [Armadillidium nasatum]
MVIKGLFLSLGKILLDNFHIYDNKILKYTYIPISGSPYSLILFTLPPTQHLQIPSHLPLKTIDPRSSFLSTWNFCGVHPLPAEPDLLNKRILEENPHCNKDLASVTFKKAPYKLFGVEWRDPIKNIALKRAVLEDGLFLIPHENGVLLSKPAYMNNIVAAVVGVNVTSKLIDEKLEDSISLKGPSMKSSIFLLVDDAAVIIASSQQKNASGEFLGRRWPLLLEKLVEADVYGIINITDHQALCEKELLHQIYTSGYTDLLFFHPLKMLVSFMTYVLHLMECFQCFFTHYHRIKVKEVLQIISTIFLTSATPKPVEGYFETKVMTSCSMQHLTYYLTDRNGFSGNISLSWRLCSSCVEFKLENNIVVFVLVTRLNSTNSILIVVEDSLVNLNCDGWKDGDTEDIHLPTTSTSMSRYRMVHPKEMACQIQRERKRPDPVSVYCFRVKLVLIRCNHSVPCGESFKTTPILYLVAFLSSSFNYIDCHSFDERLILNT